MKTKQFLIILVMVLLTSNLFAQVQAQKNYLWTINTESKTHQVGLYGAISGQYTTLFNDPAFYLGARVGVVFNQKWVIGVEGHALNYDHRLTELSTDGYYRLEAGHSGAYFEYLQSVGKSIKLSVGVLTAHGIAQYRYDKETAEHLEWYEEFLDRDHYALFQPGARVYIRIVGNWWASLEASYSTTSPVKLKGAAEDFLEGANWGLSVSYGIF